MGWRGLGGRGADWVSSVAKTYPISLVQPHPDNHSRTGKQEHGSGNSLPPRLQPTILRPTIDHHMLQTQINARGQKTRRKHQTTDLHLEPRIAPRILMHDEASDIACHLAEDAEPDGEHECPCAFPGADYELRDQEEGEERGEEGVGAQVGVVAVEGAFDGTCWRNLCAGLVVSSCHCDGCR